MKPQAMLRLALIANASFSALTGATCFFAADAVAGWTGLPAQLLASGGLELGLFALGLGFLASRSDLNHPWIRRAVGVVIALDVLWVLGSVAALLAPTPLTVAGQWTVALVALAVADFAFFQYKGWRGLGRKDESVGEPLAAVPRAA